MRSHDPIVQQVINDPGEFGLYIMQDTGVIQPCKEEDCPLMTRLKLGPNEVIIKHTVHNCNCIRRTFYKKGYFYKSSMVQFHIKQIFTFFVKVYTNIFTCNLLKYMQV